MRQPFGENLVGGDSWNWLVSLDDYCGSLQGATAKYFFRGPATDQTLDIEAVKQPDGTFQFTATGTDTKKLVGTCAWQLCVFDADGNRTQIARGSVNVLPDLESAPAGFDGRSWTKKAYDAVCAVLEGRASRVEEEYQIGGRHLRLLKPDELLKLKGDLRAALNRELIESGQKSGDANQIKAAFGPSRTRTGGWR